MNLSAETPGDNTHSGEPNTVKETSVATQATQAPLHHPELKNPEIRPSTREAAPVLQAESQEPNAFPRHLRWFGAISVLLSFWLLATFLLLCYWPSLFDMRFSLLPLGISTGCIILIRLFTGWWPGKKEHYQAAGVTAEILTDQKQRLVSFTSPLFRFIIMATIMNTVLFFFHSSRSEAASYETAPVAQMEILPVLFSLMALTICFLEQSQRRRDQTIRITALFGITILTLTYLVYLKSSLPHFWNGHLLVMFGLSLLGLALLTAFIIQDE